MGLFRRDRADRPATADEHRHGEPALIDLGMQKEWEVEMEVERLKSAGLLVNLLAQSEVPELGYLGPKHCRLYVRPEDELRVRAELASAGFL